MTSPARRAAKRAERLAESVLDGANVDWLAEAEHGIVDQQTLRTMKSLECLMADLRANQSMEMPSTPTSPTGTSDETSLFHWAGLRILERLSGGFESEMYRAHDPQLDRPVAVKLWTQDAAAEEIRRASTEAQRQAQVVENPHVARVYGVFSDCGRSGIVMEYIIGQTLESLVHERGVLSARESIGIGIELCDALSAIHAAEISHGDIKPANIMRGLGGRIVLLDLGCARSFARGNPGGDSGVFGTPLTTAPEVLLMQATADPTQDVYAVGVLLHWLLAGRYPVEAESYDALLRAHESRATRPTLSDTRPGLPAPLIALVDETLRCAPGERPQTVGELRTKLALLPIDRQPPEPGVWGRVQRWGMLCACLVGLPLSLGPNLVRSLPRHLRVYRVGAQRNELLRSGGTVTWGDAIRVDVTVDVPLHVWLINEDDRGNAYVLYPLKRGDSPMLSPGRPHVLTQDPATTRDAIILSDDANVDTFLLVASTRDIASLDALLRNVPRLGEQMASARGFGQRAPATGHASQVLDQVVALPELQSRSQGTWSESLFLVHAPSH